MTDSRSSTVERRPGGTLRAASVSRRFQGVRALEAVTLELHRHEVVGLIGPNGAGKTTLVNVLTGYDLPSAGTVELEGADVTDWPAYRRARAGLARSSTATCTGGCPCERTSR
jgi:ABC-type branched-subunit amino acid transport system ATPase component